MRPRVCLYCVVCLTAVFLGNGFLLADDDAGLTEITSIEGITEYRLENGLKVLLFPDPTKAKVTVNMTVFVGSRHEGYGEAGMAHLLEHMLFKGTPTHPNVPKALTSRGARFNGTTWVDRTNYYETLPANDENMEFAIRLEADRLINSYVKGEDLASEMTVVRNEFESGENEPSYILSQRMMAVAYEWHNYGKSTIGNRADIERVPVENLKEFYKKYYQPDNAMLVVAGQFDEKKALDVIQQSFGLIPAPERDLSNTYTEEPAQDGERFVRLRREGNVSLVGNLYHISSGAHPDYASIDVLESIMTSAPSGRLYKALVETSKASSVYGSAFALHDPGVLRFVAEVARGNDANVVLDIMLDTTSKIVEEGVTEEEVKRAQRQLLNQRELAAADSGQIAVQLSEWAAQGDWRLYFVYRDRVEKVTPESVHDVAKRYLKQSNRTVGVFEPVETPDRSTIPATPDLAAMIGEYTGRENAVAGEAFDISPENIQERTQFTKLGNIDVALLSKKTRGESVNLKLTLRYGNENNLRGLTSACEFLPYLMLKGTKNLSRQELRDAWDEVQTRTSGSGEAGSISFSMQTKRENLAAALELLRQVLREPSLPEKELEILKQGQISYLQEQLKDPQSLAQRTVRRSMYPQDKGDPRYIPTIEEELEIVSALSLAAINKIYTEYLGALSGEVAIVGDFDQEEVLPILQKTLVGWSAQQPYDRLRMQIDPYVKGGEKEILTPGKANATYFSAMAIPMRDDHPDYPAMVIGIRILGGGSLSSRLADRVRQQEGLSYGIQAGFQARSLDQRAAIFINAISNPVNMARVKTVIREEVDLLLKDGVAEKELTDAQQGYLQSQQVQRTSDAGLANILNETLNASRTMDYYDELENKVNNLTVDQVNRALRKYLVPKQLIVVTAGDFKAEAKAENEAPAAVKPD